MNTTIGLMIIFGLGLGITPGWAHANQREIACGTELALDGDLAARLRGSVASGTAALDARVPRVIRTLAPIVAGDPADLIERELRTRGHVLFDTHPGNPNKGYVVYQATGADIPVSLREVGRAREATFRTVGEGSGRALDVDEFDPYYVQLICWEKKDRVISGGYRLGKADEVVNRYGVAGLYLNQFFDFDPRILKRIASRALEVGRSFVRPEYQKGLTLSIMWLGIGQFLAENPSYRYLIGPVSISGEFGDVAQSLISRYLLDRHGHPRGRHARPRTPPKFNTHLTEVDLAEIMDGVDTLHDLRDVVRLAEDDQNLKLPTMIKAYLDLHARFIAFNFDHDFNALDGLIWTDLVALPLATQQRYMGKAAAASYRTAHGLD